MSHVERKYLLYTSVDASRPHTAFADNARKEMVEPPGIAPGSGPLITSTFIAIVRANSDKTNIGSLSIDAKGNAPKAPSEKVFSL